MSRAARNIFSPVFASAMTRFRGKWIDGEIFGKENSGSNGRYCLYCGECDDPFEPGLKGHIRVIAHFAGKRYRTFLNLDFRPACRDAASVLLPRKRVRVTGYWDDLVVLRMAVDSLQVPSPHARNGTEQAFWMAALPEPPILAGCEPGSLQIKTYRRRPRDMRERASHFPGQWLELDASLRKGEESCPGIHAAFKSAFPAKLLSAEVLVEHLPEAEYRLSVQMTLGQSSFDLLQRFQGFSEARKAGLEWAGLLGGQGELQLRDGTFGQ